MDDNKIATLTIRTTSDIDKRINEFHNVKREELKKLGVKKFSKNQAIELILEDGLKANNF